jgi:hypothetical protein
MFYRFLLSFGVMLGALGVNAQNLLNSEDLTLKIMKPQDSVDNDVMVGKVSKAAGWLAIQADFKTKEVYYKEKYQRFKINVWADSVKADIKILIPSLGEGNKENYALLTGVAEYPGIKLDGAWHSIRFFVPNYYFDRYFRPSSSMYPSASSLKSVDIMLTLTSKGRIMGAFFQTGGKFYDMDSSKGKTLYKKFAQAEKANKTMVKILKGAVLSPDKTPWCTSAIGKYEFVKPEEGNNGKR